MLPTKSNHTKDGCVATSSNCVIWQGPDLVCINLCTGDSISEVIANLATYLCTLIDQTSISEFNTTCLGAGVIPDFKSLVQLIINRICALEADSGGGGGGGIITSGCPDCMVALPACLQFTNPANQSLVTQLNLNDYAAYLAGEICKIISDITELQASVLQNTTAITTLDNRVTSLEQSSGMTPTLPNVNISCITGVPSTPLSTAVVNIATEICDLEQTVGSITDILNTALTQCVGLDSSPALSQNVLMNSLPGWTSSATTLTQTITNLWLTVCDMRSAISDIQTNCCTSLCSSINVNLNVTLTPTTNLMNFFFTGIIPVGFTNCNPAGTSFTIVGTGFTGIAATFNVIPLIGTSNSIPIPDGLNTNADFTVTGNLCLEDANGSQCQSVLSYTYTSTIACPSVTLTPTDTSIGFSFTNGVPNPIYYRIVLYNSAGTTIVQSLIRNNPGLINVLGSFTGLISGTTYRLRVEYSTDNRTFTNCPFTTTATTVSNCTPIDVRYTVAEIVITET